MIQLLKHYAFSGSLWTGLVLLPFWVSAQSATSSLPPSKSPPAGLLAGRSVVLYDYSYTATELLEVQRSFQKTGIDPIAYFQTDIVFAGKDITWAFVNYFIERQVNFIVTLEKSSQGFQFTAAPFDQKQSLQSSYQSGWRVFNEKLSVLLLTVWQDSWIAQKKQNFLINDFPETDITVDPIKGRRQEFYAIDLKVDNLAVPKFGDEAMDKDLENFFLENYPLKYKVVDHDTNEQELRRNGFLYVLCYVQTRGSAAKEVLGYDMTKSEKNYASITFPDGQLQLRIISSEQKVYKFYFRHIDNGNVFLGTKWDADINWLDALRNHIIGFKMEAKIN